MKIKQGVKAFFFGGAVLAFWGIAPGCGPSAGSYCNKVCDCSGCSETERLDCVDTVDDARKASEDKECGSEFNDYFACVSGETTCVDDKIEVDGCDAEADALAKCGGPVVIGGNACERYADVVVAKYATCNVELEVGNGEEVECSEANVKLATCLIPCVDKLGCECIDPDLIEQGACTAESSQVYSDCSSACL